MAETPDQGRAARMYERLAQSYDRRMRVAERSRRKAIARLELRPGEVVADVGCGTGLSFPAIEEKIGAGGRLIGVELSPEMAAKARERAEAAGWHNVTIVEAPAAGAELPEAATAALFMLTHDLMRSPDALANVLGQLAPGARVVAAGSKWAPRWALPVNLYVWAKARRYITTFEGFDRPWSHLEQQIGPLEVEPLFAGAGYVARGTATRPEGAPPPT